MFVRDLAFTETPFMNRRRSVMDKRLQPLVTAMPVYREMPGSKEDDGPKSNAATRRAQRITLESLVLDAETSEQEGHFRS